jgi:Periplasmic component of the Tol biopolymer transport system
LIGDVEYRAPGILLFVRRGANRGVWAVPFDKPPIDFSRAVLLAAGATAYDASADGTLVHITAPLAASELVWATRTGALSAVPGAAIEVPRQDLRVSPDGNRAALIVGGNTIVVVRDLRTGVETRLTTPNPGDARRTSQSTCPAWFPAGDRILYGSGAAEATALYSREATGAGTARKLIAGLCGVVSRDGRELYYNTDERGLSRLRRAPIAPDGTIGASSPLLPAEDESDVGWFDVSADGTLLAYEAKQQDQQLNVWITDVPNGTSRWQVTTGGGRLPRFGRDGRELFHLAPAAGAASNRMGALMAVPLTTKPAFAMAAPQTLFTLDQPDGPLSVGGYDVASDGRFLFTRTAAPTGEKPRAVLVQNWTALIPK